MHLQQNSNFNTIPTKIIKTLLHAEQFLEAKIHKDKPNVIKQF